MTKTIGSIEFTDEDIRRLGAATNGLDANQKKIFYENAGKIIARASLLQQGINTAIDGIVADEADRLAQKIDDTVRRIINPRSSRER